MTASQKGFANRFQNPLGYQQITDVSSAVGLPSIPASATMAVIYVEGAAVRWRDDGTNPTSTIGMPVAAGQAFPHLGNLSTLKFIQQSAGAILNVSYYA